MTTTITLPIPASLVSTATDPVIAAVAADVAAKGRAAVAELLDGMCDDLGLDRWETWRKPSRHAQIEQFQQAIGHLSADDALTRPSYDRSAA